MSAAFHSYAIPAVSGLRIDDGAITVGLPQEKDFSLSVIEEQWHLSTGTAERAFPSISGCFICPEAEVGARLR